MKRKLLRFFLIQFLRQFDCIKYYAIRQSSALNLTKNRKEEQIEHLQKHSEIMQLEEDLGFARGSIYKWDTNTPSVSKVKAVADRLGTTVDALLTSDDEAE